MYEIFISSVYYKLLSLSKLQLRLNVFFVGSKLEIVIKTKWNAKQMSFFLSIIFDTTKLFTKDNHAILKMIDQSNTKLLNICKLNLSFIFYSDKHLY